jgi:cytoskeletal protein CcmA (bactofilin family)
MSQQGAPPPPPKRKNHKPVAVYGSSSGIPVAVGSGHNVARAIINESYQTQKSPARPEVAPRPAKYEQEAVQQPARGHQQARVPKNRICVIDGHPDAVIGFGVEIHGDFQYDKLLRVDGKFQGNLFSNNRGDIVVGKSGCIIGDVIIARKMIVEGGHVIGKIVVEELLLQDNTIVKGDVTCKLLQIEGPSVTINGRANVHALAPEIVDENDNIITEFPKVGDLTSSDVLPKVVITYLRYT